MRISNVHRHAQRIASTAAVALAIAGVSSAAQAPALAKQVAAPASDVESGRVRLPKPDELASRSRAAAVPVRFERAASGAWSFETTLALEDHGSFALALAGVDAARWSARVSFDRRTFLPLAGAFGVERTRRAIEAAGDDLPGWVVDRYEVSAATAGLYRLRVEAASADAADDPGMLVLRSTSSLEASAHWTTLSTLADAEVGLVASLRDVAPLVDAVRVAFVDLEVGGAAWRQPLFDDGLHGDGAARDGTFGTLLAPGVVGEVRARVELRALVGGRAVVRTVQLAQPFLERRTLLDGSARASVEDAQRLRLELGAWPLGAPQKLHVSAEVWGTASDGELAPACWLSRMIEPELRAELWSLPLSLDGRWLDVAGVRPPLELRNVRVQDPDTHVPFDRVDRIALDVAQLPAIVGQGDRTITTDMLMGPPSVSSASQAGPRAATGHVLFQRSLMLAHGYCSGGAIWPAADFSQPKMQFLDPNANRTHDQFAQLMLQASSGLGSFGVVAHSQGGMAALHLYTYYQSGLDDAVGVRLIQSVGSPYQGTPLASWGGFACGVNADMTPSGSATWLAGIPSWARAEVFYWTTQNSGSVCNFFTSLLLDDPEDGTTEMARGQLPGGNSMGHVSGWCHTTGMSNPAQYTDHARNAQMNLQAAR